MINYIIQTIGKIALYLTKSRTEPCIEYKCSPGCHGQGDCYWQVYDPVSGLHTSFGSETEVKAWLDRRYYYD